MGGGFALVLVGVVNRFFYEKLNVDRILGNRMFIIRMLWGILSLRVNMKVWYCLL